MQTACSTSLVAVHLACQSLLAGECDMALAGGVVDRSCRRATGYLYHEGGIISPDGHCRAFDAAARGTVGGSGVGVVVLKRLADALRDGDTIRAVIRARRSTTTARSRSATRRRASTARPRSIAAALGAAGVAPETHRLRRGARHRHAAGRSRSRSRRSPRPSAPAPDARGFCALGSVKTNIGHLDAAAGVAGLIKAVLALEHRQIPPSLHFETPNPQIDFAASPFYVNTAAAPTGRRGRRAAAGRRQLVRHRRHQRARRPGGGAGRREPSGPSRPLAAAAALGAHRGGAGRGDRPTWPRYLARASGRWTWPTSPTRSRSGRRAFEHRRIAGLPGRRRRPRAALASARPGAGARRAGAGARDAPVAFLFPGQGAQYAGMGRELYERPSRSSAREIDRCAELLLPHLGLDLREVLYPPDGGRRRRRAS